MKAPSDMTVAELAEVVLRFWEQDRQAAAASCDRIAAGPCGYADKYRLTAEYIRKD